MAATAAAATPDNESFDLGLDFVTRFFRAAAPSVDSKVIVEQQNEASEASEAQLARRKTVLQDVVRTISTRLPPPPSELSAAADAPASPSSSTAGGKGSRRPLQRRRTTKKVEPLPEKPKSFFYDDDDDDGDGIKDTMAVNVQKLYIQIGEDVKKVSFNAPPPVRPQLQKLFEKKFSFKVGIEDQFPAFYIKDADESVFYELEDYGSIHEKATIKIKVSEGGDDDPRNKHAKEGSSSNSFKKIMSEMAQLKQAVMSGSKDADEKRKAAELLLNKQREVSASQRQHFVEKLKQQEACIKDMRVQLKAMKQLYESNVVASSLAVTELQKRLSAHFNTQLPALVAKAASVAGQTIDVDRARLNEEKKQIDQESRALREKIATLQQRTQQIADDLLKRRCKPSDVIMAQVDRDMKEVERLVTQHSAHFNKEAKQAWKKQWERDMQFVVAEQKVLKDQEATSDEIEDDYTELTEALDALGRQLKANESAAPREFVAPELPEGVSASDLRKTILSQITTRKVDTEKRLKAAQANEAQRLEDLKQRTDPFEEELGQFVQKDCLRKTGGWQDIERARQLRDLEVLKGTYGNSNTTATSSPAPEKKPSPIPTSAAAAAAAAAANASTSSPKTPKTPGPTAPANGMIGGISGFVSGLFSSK